MGGERERKERPTTTESLRRRQGREMLSFIKRKIGSCLSECNISTDSFGGNISSSGKNSIKSRRWEVVSEGNGQGCRRYGGVQTRKRRLGSKIDREIGTESLDAEIKYSYNKDSLEFCKTQNAILLNRKKNNLKKITNYDNLFFLCNFLLEIIIVTNRIINKQKGKRGIFDGAVFSETDKRGDPILVR